MTDHLTGTSTAKETWWKRRWVIGIAAGALGLGLGIGAASSVADPTGSSEYKSLAADLNDAQTKLASTTSRLEPALAAVAEIDAREQALDGREGMLDVREGQIKDDAAAVKKREKKVGIIEADIESNTISGDGMYEVGKDIKAGTYKTKGGGACYYAVLRDTEGSIDSIVNNNNISGAGILSVSNGQFLELSGCGEWVRQ